MYKFICGYTDEIFNNKKVKFLLKGRREISNVKVIVNRKNFDTMLVSDSKSRFSGLSLLVPLILINFYSLRID